MERLRARTDQGDPPGVNYSVQPVHLVGDSSDLLGTFYGPRAICGQALPNPGAGSFASVQVLSGSRGVRVGLRIGQPPVTGSIGWRILPPTVAPAFTVLTLFQQNPTSAGRLDTIVRTGSFGISQIGVDQPQAVWAALTTSPLVIPFSPLLWLEPNRMLQVDVGTANQGFQFDCVLEEPAMEVTP